ACFSNAHRAHLEDFRYGAAKAMQRICFCDIKDRHAAALDQGLVRVFLIFPSRVCSLVSLDTDDACSGYPLSREEQASYDLVRKLRDFLGLFWSLECHAHASEFACRSSEVFGTELEPDDKDAMFLD